MPNTQTPEEILGEYGRSILRIIDDDTRDPRDKFALQAEFNAELSKAQQAILTLINSEAERREREAFKKCVGIAHGERVKLKKQYHCNHGERVAMEQLQEAIQARIADLTKEKPQDD